VDAGAGYEMVAIPPGPVTLSDRRTQRSWSVELAPYQLAAFPITQARYAQVTGERPSTAQGDQLPVEGVSWLDAVRFCNALSQREGLAPAYRLHADVDGSGNDSASGPPDGPTDRIKAGDNESASGPPDGPTDRIKAGDNESASGPPDGPADRMAVEWDASADGYRLPTEAEWEHACRAGTTGARYGRLDEIAWHRGNSYERIHDVGGKQPNAWGLYDMLGNVWDWCWDIYDAEVYGTYRVLRGGGWFDEHWSCRASVRRRSHPTFQIDDVGFRIARSILR
jgi:sulfatase modifying factor 1